MSFVCHLHGVIRKLLGPCAVAAIVGWLCQPALAIQSFIINPDNTLTFYNVNDIVGANTFYNAGFTGTTATVAEIDAGLVWNGHDTLTGVTTQIPNPGISNGYGQFDQHATWVGSALAGEGSTVQGMGIAPGAQLWSGAIATSWNPPDPGYTYSGNFNVTDDSLIDPYVEALITGVNGQTANVVSSSWGAGDGQDGDTALVVAMDALASQSGATMVFAAGNSGPTTNTVFQPASGNNFIVVGASDEAATPAFSAVASFSSVGPSDYFLPFTSDGSEGELFEGARATIDLVAPGDGLVLAHYGGATGGNAFGGPTSTLTDSYDYYLAGTSFATPIVAGGAALVVDAGKQLYPTDPNAIDGRVVKAVLMNSATELPGYNNGQAVDTNGIITTTQALDYTQGAGQLNLTAAYAQYTGGTHDVPTPLPAVAPGGIATPVQANGWAYGVATASIFPNTSYGYLITTPQNRGYHLTTTLDWFSNEQYDTTDPGAFNTSYGDFWNLTLQVYETGTVPTKLVAQSESQFTSVQHLNFTLPDTAEYLIEVTIGSNAIYNFDGSTGAPYGLAWSVALPEPASMGLLMFGVGALMMRRRSKRTA
ncbi:MAG: S8 family serine peptidase [Tepidisphaeraceae bacterium]|jgi:hypothetical protein